MATYYFEDITNQQAGNIEEGDEVIVRRGTAPQTTVILNDNGLPSVTIEGRTVAFGPGFLKLANGTGLGVVYPDNSALYIGSVVDDRINLPANLKVPQNGAAYGGAGDDTFSISSGSWLVQGNQGNDRFQFSGPETGSHTVYGGQGNDSIVVEHRGVQFAQGNKGDDYITSLGSSNTVLGGQGNDTVTGGGKMDFLNGNLGDDKITGAGTLLGEGGNDTIVGGGLVGTVCRGGDGNDDITLNASTPSAPTAFAYGDDGDDRIVSNGSGRDELYGGAGNDTITSANNPIEVGDLVDGGDGDDVITMKDGGRDTIDGGAGRDTIDSAGGTDLLRGGAGADLFVQKWYVDLGNNSLADQILDWSAEDRIQLDRPFVRGYAEGAAADIQSANDMARALESQIPKGADTLARGAVAIQIGNDVHIYELAGDGIVGVVGVLVGRSLVDISRDNFI